MKRQSALAALCLGAALVSGCTNLVTITSEPSGARVMVDGAEGGRTPFETRVSWWPWKRNRIILEHPECHPLSTVLRRTFQVPDPPAGWEETQDDMDWVGGVAGLALLGVVGPIAIVDEGGSPWWLVVCALPFGALRGPVGRQHFVLAPRRKEPGGGASPPPDEDRAQVRAAF